MINILIVDAQESSCYFMKSILMGRGHRVSISSILRDARDKAQTGLFDLVFADLSGADEESVEFVKKLNEEQPWLPVIAVVEPKGSFDEELKLADTVTRPIKVKSVIEAAQKVALAAGHRPSIIKDDAVISAEVETSSGRLRCVIKRVSDRAFLIESASSDGLSNDTDFQNFFINSRGEELNTVIHPKDGESIDIKGKVAFTDRTVTGGRIRGIGLTLDDPEMAARAFALPAVESTVKAS